MDVIKAKSALFSKINWTAWLSMAGTLFTLFGWNGFDAQMQTEILAAILAVNVVITTVLRTWFNNSVGPEMAGKTVTVVKA